MAQARTPQQQKGRSQRRAKGEEKVLLDTDERPEYIIHEGLRYVVPYAYTFSTYAKGRWVGRQLLDVLCDEFIAETKEYYEEAVKQGRITVNGDKVAGDYVLQQRDLLEHSLHRHEPPVSAAPVTIVRDDGDVVVVDKPASIPVHPCGRYRHNSVMMILAREHGLNDIKTVHRLDRLTSGVLLFARTQQAAQRLFAQISGRDVRKQYLCRVRGIFPEGPVECTEPILKRNHRVGLCAVDAEGKDAATTFTRLHSDPNGRTSVVLCQPRTGRMHQIRVHLQYLGYPIANDPLYASRVWGPGCGKGGIPRDVFDKAGDILATIMNAPPLPPITVPDPPANTGQDTEQDQPPHKRPQDTSGSASPPQVKPKRPRCDDDDAEDISESHVELDAETMAANREAAERIVASDIAAALLTHIPPAHIVAKQSENRDPMCSECRFVRPDPPPAERFLYLHAWRYEGDGWAYETDMPAWARDDWHDVTEAEHAPDETDETEDAQA